jgi:protein-tyrosine phosphatase
METLVNVRDLGGYAAPEGKIVRYGLFLRAECPVGLSEKDLRFLKEYGITLSLDLRGADEAKALPSSLKEAPGHTYIHCPISQEPAILHGDGEAPSTMPPPPPENFDLGDSYIDIAETAKTWVKRVFELCADWDGGVLFHCFVGKDRAGIIAAMLLGACGVADTDILMDYSASMSCLRPKYDRMVSDFLPRKRGRPDYSWGFYGSVPETMEALLYHLNEKYGGITAYLKACGISGDTIEKLRGKLLEAAAE